MLGRAPRYYEFRAAMDPPAAPPPLDVGRLGFLADSHDPDIAVRIITAKNDFAAMLRIVAIHERLQLGLQRQMAQIDARAGIAPSTDDVPKVVSKDVMVQLETVVKGLQTILPELMKSLKRVGDDLRDVLRFQLPSRSFLKFIPQARGPLSEAKTYAVKPAKWRRTVREVRGWIDRLFGPRWPT